MFDVLPCIKVYGFNRHMASHILNGVCKHILQRSRVHIHVALRAVDGAMAQQDGNLAAIQELGLTQALAECEALPLGDHSAARWRFSVLQL